VRGAVRGVAIKLGETAPMAEGYGLGGSLICASAVDWLHRACAEDETVGGRFGAEDVGVLSTGGSPLHELVHLGEGVVPGVARDWTQAICSEVCHEQLEA
jgi:hypothetical protein